MSLAASVEDLQPVMMREINDAPCYFINANTLITAHGESTDELLLCVFLWLIR